MQYAGPAPADAIEVRVSLIADSDAVVGSAHAHIQPLMLKPGGRAPWLAQAQRPPSFARVRVNVQARPLTGFLHATVSQELRAENVAVCPPVNPGSPPAIVGEVVDDGRGQPARNVKVAASILDREGALFQVVADTIESPQFAPSEGAPFGPQPVSRGLVDVPGYRLFVEGRLSP